MVTYDKILGRLREGIRIAFANISGSPMDNNNLATALNAKANQTDLVTVQGTANTALGNANNAYALADTANGKATDAQGTANNAYTLASQVQGIANEAKGTANNANAAAVAAQGTANTALGNANNAYALADTANGKAVQADGKADNANSLAQSAISSLTEKADKTDTYTKIEVDAKVNTLPKSSTQTISNTQKYTFEPEVKAFTESEIFFQSDNEFIIKRGPEHAGSTYYYLESYPYTPAVNDVFFTENGKIVYVTNVIASDLLVFNRTIKVLEENETLKIYPIVTPTSVALGAYSHAEGYNNKALGANSHVGGCNNVSQKSDSFVHGEGLVDLMHNGAYFGKYNKDYSNWGDKPFFEVAYGWDDNRQTMFMVQENSGNVFGKGSYNVMNGDYAEMFEWLDGNTDGIDRVGLFVALNENKIVVAKSGDEIIGVVSATPAIVGDSGAMDWKNKYLTDEWGRMLYDIDESGNRKPKLNPVYNSEKEYVPRMYRKEWSPIGLLGKLKIRHDGTLTVGGHCKCNDDGMATACDTGFIVMEVNSENIATILVK